LSQERASDRNRAQDAAPARIHMRRMPKRGWAELEEDGTLKGQICVRGGLEADFTA